MSVDNFYHGISRFSLSTIFCRYLYDTKPEKVWLSDKTFLIQPLGIKSGMTFYHQICANLFENIWIDHFKNPIHGVAKASLYNEKFVDELFRLIDDVYNFDGDESLYSLLQNSNLKQIKYLLYVIKLQNFLWYDSNRFLGDSYSTIMNTIQQMDKMLSEYQSHVAKSESRHKIIEVEAVEYAGVSSEISDLDHTVQFYKDYILGNDVFYALVSSSYISKFAALCNSSPVYTERDDPPYQCKVNNSPCIQSCRSFDPSCTKRLIKNLSYFPFKSIYVLPQLISFLRTQEKENEMDVLIRSILFSLAVSFGEKSSVKSHVKIDHNWPIHSIIDKNKMLIVKSLFDDFEFNSVENDIRTSLGLEERKLDSFENAHEILVKIYRFVEANKNAFLMDKTKIDVFDKFLIDVSSVLLDRRYSSQTLMITSDSDFTGLVESISNEVVHIDTMLMQFPNDMKGMDSLSNNLLKAIQESRKDMQKMAGGKTPIDPRESLIKSDSALFRRIAVDDSLYQFYRQNNKTKLINSISFWKWTIGQSFLAELLLHLPEDHAIQTMDFNDPDL